MVVLLQLTLVGKQTRYYGDGNIQVPKFDFNELLQQFYKDGLIDAPGLGEGPKEMPRGAISLLDLLGQGQFGEVRSSA